jgi:hypothetical protein
MDHDNKRNHFRVDALMPVNWHILNEAEIDLVQKGLGCSLLTQNYFKSPIEQITEQVSSSMKNDHIYHSLNLLNNKLDYIINMMLSDYGPTSTGDRILEISASGLKFRTVEKIDAGVYLKMRLLVSGTTYFQMEFIAKTLRVDKIDNGYLHAANIVCIDDDARDLIVKMIFQKQRVDIRRLKTNQEVGKSD